MRDELPDDLQAIEVSRAVGRWIAVAADRLADRLAKGFDGRITIASDGLVVYFR